MIAVTGASSFIGRNLVPYLSQCFPDQHLVSLIRHTTSSKHVEILSKFSSCVFVESENELNDSLKGVSYIVHLAALTPNQNHHHSLLDTYQTNFMFALKIAELASRNGIRFVNIGSSWQNDLEEEIPKTHYGVAKKSFESVLSLMKRSNSLEYVHLEFCDTYGPGDVRSNLLNLLLHAFRNAEPVTVKNPFGIVDYLHVHDVLSAIRILIEDWNHDGRKYSLQSQDLFYVVDFVEFLSDLLSYDFKSVVPPDFEPIHKINAHKNLHPFDPPIGWLQTIDCSSGLKSFFGDTEKLADQ